MLEKLFESASFLLKGVITGALLIAATAAAIFVAFFAVMTAYRVIELLWRAVFSRPFPI